LQRRKTRTRQLELGAALSAALCLAGCGGGGEHRAAPQPKLPAPIARDLAARSDRVAAALAEDNSCRALAEANALQRETVAAINARRVPAALQEDLSGTVNDLVRRIECVPPPVEDKHGKEGDEHKGKGKGKKKHGGKD
jgi:hypothetical protein